MKKLQNSFNQFLPMTYHQFIRGTEELTSNEAVVASLLKVSCEENDVKAIKLAFERILGKPEKVVIIKRTNIRVVYPEATGKQLTPPVLDPLDEDEEEATAPILFEDQVVVDEADAPGRLLRRMLDEIGAKRTEHIYEVLENKNRHTVAEVLVANLYSIAIGGTSLGAISMLFDYLDGSIADVIRVEGLDTIQLDNYASVAPYDAIQDENGVWYIEREAVK